MKPTKSFRIDPELIELAKAKGINITKLVEAALAKAVKDKRCPYCGANGFSQAGPRGS